MIRRHYADEEPDVDELPFRLPEGLVAGWCTRCGWGGHRAAACRAENADLPLDRRT